MIVPRAVFPGRGRGAQRKIKLRSHPLQIPHLRALDAHSEIEATVKPRQMAWSYITRTSLRKTPLDLWRTTFTWRS